MELLTLQEENETEIDSRHEKELKQVKQEVETLKERLEGSNKKLEDQKSLVKKLLGNRKRKAAPKDGF